MRILTKKILREIQLNKFRSSIIIITIFVTISMGVGLINLKSSAEASRVANDEKLSNADLRIRLNEYNTLENLTSALNESEIQNAGILKLEGRIFLYSSIYYEGELHSAYLIGVNLEINHINKLHLIRGSKQLLSHQVLVEQHFTKEIAVGENAALNDFLSINLFNSTVNVSIGGIVADSDYSFVVNEQTDVPSLGELCIIYFPLERLQSILQINGINEILVKISERSHEASQKADQIISGNIGSNKIKKVIYWDNTADGKFFDLRINTFDKIGIVFGLFGLITGAIAIYNSVSKLIAAQKTHIGLFGALGAQNRELLRVYLSYGVILSVVGIFFGLIGASLLVTVILDRVAVKVLVGFVVTKSILDPVTCIFGVILTFIVILISSLFATLPVFSLTPNEALNAPYSSSELGKVPLLERIISSIGLLGKFTSKIPIRSVFMNRKRSLTTSIAITASMIILIVSTSFAYDYILGMDRNYVQNEKYDVQVVLKQPTSEQILLDWFNTSISGIKRTEGFISTYVWIETERILLTAFHEDSELRNYNIIEGSNEFSENKIIIGSILLKNLDLSLGDKITFSFDLISNVTVEISGVTGEMADNSLLWSIEALKSHIQLDDSVSGVAFTYEEPISKEEKKDIQNSIQEFFRPYAYIETSETLKGIKQILEASFAILIVIAALGLGTLVLFSFSSMSLALLGRELEFLALRALGAKRRTILKIIFVENLLYGITGFIIGIPISLVLLKPTYSYLVPNWYIPVEVPLELWGIVVGILILCVFLSTSLYVWKTWKISLADMLRNRMVS
ncbi:MAG: ABC transporter permease [Candidatus Hodarchaeota archaeon]